MLGFSRGAFTGAYTPKPGPIELADCGTLFLDEVDELPVEAQAKLLRMLQHGELEKVRSRGPSTVDVRVLAAMNRNLPPLRERREDIPELVQHLFLKLKEKHGMKSLRMPSSLEAHFLRLPVAGERSGTGECGGANDGAVIRR